MNGMIKVILIDWGKNNIKSERNMGFDWFYNKQGVYSILKNMRQRKSQPFELILVINDASLENEYDYLQDEFKFIETIIYRSSNMGLDWGGYNEGVQYLKKQSYEGDLILMNSGCIGPTTNDWIDPYAKLFNSDDNVGLVGTTYCGYAICLEEQPFSPHIQSYFLYSSMSIVTSILSDGLPGLYTDEKSSVIEKAEIEFSQKVLKKGYCIKAKLDNFHYSLGDPWVFFNKKMEPKFWPGCFPFYI